MPLKNRISRINILLPWQDLRFKLAVQGMIVGLLSGLVIVLYRYLLDISSKSTYLFYQSMQGKPVLIIITLVLLAVAGLSVGFLVRAEPLISGSGIPQLSGYLLRKLDMPWWRVVLGKFIGGIISLGAGLSLGREGPSVQIGAAIGLGFSKIFHKISVDTNYLVTAGASAGLAAAFNAPLAGIIFAMEEVRKHFSPLIILSAATAAVVADYVAKEFLGLGVVFACPEIDPLPLRMYALLILLGILLGIVGAIFNRSLVAGMDFFRNRKWLPDYLRPVPPFVAVGVLALYLPLAIGGGHRLIEILVDTRLALGTVALLLVVKFIFTVFCYGSGVPGGIFLPLLTLGALFGNLYGETLVHFLNVNPVLICNFTILAMAGIFAGIVRSPITGIILITEMTGSFSHLLALIVISMAASITADMFWSKPVYESLLGHFLARHGLDEQTEEHP